MIKFPSILNQVIVLKMNIHPIHHRTVWKKTPNHNHGLIEADDDTVKLVVKEVEEEPKIEDVEIHVEKSRCII